MPLRKRGATIEGRKSVRPKLPEGVKFPNRIGVFKMPAHHAAWSISSPDLPQSSADVAAVNKRAHLALFYDCNLDIGAMDKMTEQLRTPPVHNA